MCLTVERLLFALALSAAAVLPGCTQDGFIGMAAGATLLGAQAPASEIEQVYYLGCFDPQSQLPPTVYRVTVHGQASAISFMKFGSGWVPAPLIDSLGTQLSFDKTTGKMNIDSGDNSQLSDLQTGRRLILFGPEGFREAPKDHRLVIVMGTSPEKFFSAIDQSLDAVSQGRAAQVDGSANDAILKALLKVQSEKNQLASISTSVNAKSTSP